MRMRNGCNGGIQNILVLDCDISAACRERATPRDTRGDELRYGWIFVGEADLGRWKQTR